MLIITTALFPARDILPVIPFPLKDYTEPG